MDVQSLAGKVATLSQFISKMYDRCKSFFRCIKQSSNLECGEEQSEALKGLKRYLSTVPILLALNEEDDLFLYLAVSDIEVSGVLMREKGGRQKLVFYTSKMLLDTKMRYITMEKNGFSLGHNEEEAVTLLQIPHNHCNN